MTKIILDSQMPYQLPRKTRRILLAPLDSSSGSRYKP